jgi:hypothetical protein
VIDVLEHADSAGVLSGFVAVFALENISAIPQQSAVEPEAIGNAGHGCIGIADDQFRKWSSCTHPQV